MPSSGIRTLDQIVGGRGYPEKSAILISGPPGVGKEALCYWFIQSGLQEGDFCLYVTRLSRNEVVEDGRAFGIAAPAKAPVWIARDGGQFKLDINNLPSLFEKVKGLLNTNIDRKIRIVVDALSSVLTLNPPETSYRFVNQLIEEAKRHNAVLLATLEEGMHSLQTQAAMQQLFDGVVELSFQRTRLRIFPLLRIGKMRGLTPQPDYYKLSFTPMGVQLALVGLSDVFGGVGPSLTSHEWTVQEEPALTEMFAGTEAGVVFDYLVKAFLEDYKGNKLAIEQAGWRTRIAIADATGVTRVSFYGKEGKFGSVLKELLSSGLVETRFFPGQRGRGGEVIKLRIAYEKELVKRLVNRVSGSAGGVE